MKTKQAPIEYKADCEGGLCSLLIHKEAKPQNLLDSCLLWSAQTGGTIHDFMPRLGVSLDGWDGHGAWWNIRLDDITIAKVCSDEKPVIEPGLQARFHLVPVSAIATYVRREEEY